MITELLESLNQETRLESALDWADSIDFNRMEEKTDISTSLSKITSLTGANKISVGEKVFELLPPEVKADFRRLVPRKGEWRYINRDNGKLYQVYTMK
jgi:hypothetical protein